MQDEMIPPAQMQQLREFSNAPTEWCECPNSSHMDAYMVDETIYWRSIKEFWTAKIS